MHQVALQPQTGRHFTQRRALWFVSVLLVLLIISAMGLTWLILHSARERIPVTLEHDLTPSIQQRTAMLTVWHGKVQTQVTRLTGMDMLRLFATEVNDLGDKAGAMVALERQEQTSPGDSDNVSRLASQMPLMRKLFEDLIAQTEFTAAMLVTPSLHVYLTNAAQASAREKSDVDLLDQTPGLRQAVRASVNTGKATLLPAHRNANGRLDMVMVQPLFAPEYISRTTPKAVGAAVLVCDVSSIVRESTVARAGESGQEGWLAQKVEQDVQPLFADERADMRLQSGWRLDASGNLPIGLRTLPNGDSAYVLGKLAPDLPWIVIQDVTAASVEAEYNTYRSQVVFVVGSCTLIAILLIGMFWWWLVGRRERALSNELKQLYQTVNQQHELLSGINGTLADGIVLHDTHGVIGYVNEAFAFMTGKNSDDLIGQNISALFEKKRADRMLRHMEQVIGEGKSELYSEAVTVGSDRRHFQVACSPFHNEEGETTGVVSVYRDVTEQMRAQEHAQTMLHQTVSVLVRAIEAIDPYLRGQSMQTGILASHLAQGLQLGATHANTVRSAANLSQIGMIQLPRNLVNKAGSLTDQERKELQQHVEFARSSLQGIDFGLPVVDAIYQMHELMDGSGYPQKLSGEDIIIDARILAVANTFCALMRPRSYRQAHTVDDALAILTTMPPKYDPAVVQALQDFLQTPTGVTFLRSLITREKE